MNTIINSNRHKAFFCTLLFLLFLICTPLITQAEAGDGGGGGGGGIGGFLGDVGKGISGGISSGISAVGGMFSGGDGGGNNSGPGENGGDRGGYEDAGTYRNQNTKIDLVPVTKSIDIGQSETTFEGQINLVKTNQPGNWPSYNEGGGDYGGSADYGGGNGAGSSGGGAESATGPSGGTGHDSGPGDSAPGTAGDCSGVCGISTSTHKQPSDKLFENQAAAAANSVINNNLLIDYSCDDTIDVTKAFQAPNTTIYRNNSGKIPLSVTVDTGSNGDHCFAFAVDTKNIVSEANEKNNTTGWHTFTIETSPVDLTIPTPSSCPSYSPPICEGGQKLTSGAKLANGCNEAPYCSTPTPTTVVECPVYSPPLCTDGQTLQSGIKLENGCSAAPYCGTSSDTTGSTAIMNFEVRVFQEEPGTGGSPSVRILKKDWTSSDVTVDSDDILHFRWNAPSTAQCLIDINPVQYVFDGSNTQNSGNTELLDIEIATRAETYSIACTEDNIETAKTINVNLN